MVEAYRFLREDMTCDFRAEAPWQIGERRTFEGMITTDKGGYYSAGCWWDALQYAPGPVACIVEVSEPFKVNHYQQVSYTCKLVAALDVSRELRLFACDQAEAVLRLARIDDKRWWAALKIVREVAGGEAERTETAAHRLVWDAAQVPLWADIWKGLRSVIGSAIGSANQLAEVAATDALWATVQTNNRATAAKEATWAAISAAGWDAYDAAAMTILKRGTRKAAAANARMSAELDAELDFNRRLAAVF